VTDAIAEYIAETRANKSKKTYQVYELPLRVFSPFCAGNTLGQLNRKHIVA
jgi:hypothetical protein